MTRRLCCLALFAATACAAKAPSPVAAPDTYTADQVQAPAPALDKSLFARTPQGSLTEAKLQEILDRPLELELPARVGVLPIVDAEDWRGPGPSYDMVSPALSRFADKLPADDGFSNVTEMMPIPSGALGMEALREAAARYKLRYLLLYREDVNQSRRGNGIASGYATIVGAFFLPGSTLEVDGYSEVSLFDVKTGILLFTVRRRIEKSRRSNVWQRERKLDQMQRDLALDVAGELAKDTRTALAELQGKTLQSAGVQQEGLAAAPSTVEVGP
jgi:hypothetical protein